MKSYLPFQKTINNVSVHPQDTTLCNTRIAIILSDAEIIELRNMGTVRNEIAHAGGKSLKKETLIKHFEFIRKWLQVIDYHLGYEWVNDYSSVKYIWQQMDA